MKGLHLEDLRLKTGKYYFSEGNFAVLKHIFTSMNPMYELDLNRIQSSNPDAVINEKKFRELMLIFGKKRQVAQETAMA